MSHTRNTNVRVTMNAKLEAHKLCTRDPIIGPGRQAASIKWITNKNSPSYKPQAASVKPEDLHATNTKNFISLAEKDTSRKRQAPSSKLQAPSRKRQAP